MYIYMFMYMYRFIYLFTHLHSDIVVVYMCIVSKRLTNWPVYLVIYPDMTGLWARSLLLGDSKIYRKNHEDKI